MQGDKSIVSGFPNIYNILYLHIFFSKDVLFFKVRLNKVAQKGSSQEECAIAGIEPAIGINYKK